MYKLSGYMTSCKHWHARHSKQCKCGKLQQLFRKHIERACSGLTPCCSFEAEQDDDLGHRQRFAKAVQGGHSLYSSSYKYSISTSHADHAVAQQGCRPRSRTACAAALWPAQPTTLPAGWQPAPQPALQCITLV